MFLTLPVLLSLVLSITKCSVYAASDTKVQALKDYKNPIISGFSPDPSCIHVDEQFFCVTSSFSAFPGIPVYTSRDLVQWEQIVAQAQRWDILCHVNAGHHWKAVRGLVAIGEHPIRFTFTGYDTSLFWDDDGKVYVQGSHYWRIFPAVQQFQIDLKTGASLNGDPVTIWNGTGGMAPEGPHIYKKDGFYYLLIAEGGTALGPMVTMARATNIHGPYDPCPYNPVLTNANTTEYLQTVGHADLFEDSNSNWWSVALATRNATVDFPMGRETILVPVVWHDGEFPVFNRGTPGRAYIDMNGPLPARKSAGNVTKWLSVRPTLLTSGDVHVGQHQRIQFNPGSKLPRKLIYYRYPDFSAFTVSPPSHPNTLRIMGSANNISGTSSDLTGTSTFIARRQDEVEFTASVSLDFEPRVDGEEAGLTLFLNKVQHFDLGVVALNGTQRFIRLRTITANSTDGGSVDPISSPRMIILPQKSNHLRLVVQAVNASTYMFGYSDQGNGVVHTVGYG
ncbi:hypothetical protein BD410DRAFT_859486 [Rickenella mellea]|uniref:Beta-xylosidase C-terminal Concanavalin A-like domain-containing protein n=1 Tax=Rickenella mellea TaxID=50990 RepID=A0A4Y7Q5Y5_9AGAM|nr:hypothetical protein BD410DRAFT_859486 [Rickenella mellea]